MFVFFSKLQTSDVFKSERHEVSGCHAWWSRLERISKAGWSRLLTVLDVFQFSVHLGDDTELTTTQAAGVMADRTLSTEYNEYTAWHNKDILLIIWKDLR